MPNDQNYQSTDEASEMSFSQYIQEYNRLKEVLKDAVERGDYYLEMDVTELIENLNNRYHNS